METQTATMPANSDFTQKEVGQKAKVYINGQVETVEIFAVDENKIYFANPKLSQREGLKDKLVMRKIGYDEIEMIA